MKRIESSAIATSSLIFTARKFSISFVIIGTLLCAAASDISGQWEFQVQTFNDTSYARVQLKAEGEKVSGRLNELTLAGSLKGDEITFAGTRPDGKRYGEFSGRVEGEGLQGTVNRPGGIKGTWTARRAAQAPASPRT